MLRHAPLAPLTVLAPQRRPDHARHAEVALVELPLADQLVDDGFLLGDALHLGDEARVVGHGAAVEVAHEGEAGAEAEVEPPVGFASWMRLGVFEEGKRERGRGLLDESAVTEKTG